VPAAYKTILAACGVQALVAGAFASSAFAQSTEGREIIVNGILPSEDDTYRTRRAEVGPLGEKALLDTPYSISVVPVNLAENQQLQNVRELFRYIPSVQGENIRPQSRGMQAGVVQNTRIDGLNIAATTDYAIEQFDRIEVLNGLAGSLYGPASPAGTFNYVFKRPTEQALSAVKLGYTSDGNILAHVDISRRAGPNGIVGARINLLSQEGETYADSSNLRRRLASASFDLRPAEGTRVELNASYYRYTATGFPGTFSFARGVSFAAVEPSAKRSGYGYRWAGDDNETVLASGRLFQAIGSDWHLSAGVLYMTNDRASTVPTLTVLNAAGAYRATTVNTTFSLDRVLSNHATLRGTVDLGGIRNEVFVGTTGFLWKRYTPYQTGAITLGTGNLANPAIFAQPLLPDFKDRFHAQTTRQQAITFGDTITFNDMLSVLVAGSQSWISARNINRIAVVTSRYKDDGFSPTASLILKPRANMTAYVTYASSLQQGDAAPTAAANAGDTLAPYRSEQWEAGYKINLGRIDFALAAYQIKRPYAFVGTDNVFREQGRQRNRGIELTANGRITDSLNLFGGVSLLDPKLFDTGSALANDKQILSLPKLAFNVLGEYRLPMLPQITLSADVSHVSQRPSNYSNTDFVDGYTLVDLGIRYQANLNGQALALRLSVNNLLDERYWANVAPTGQNGYNSTDNGTGTLGTPRSVRLQMQVAL
jgi:iron complex outermembrane receptor protein